MKQGGQYGGGNGSGKEGGGGNGRGRGEVGSREWTRGVEAYIIFTFQNEGHAPSCTPT